ncbi:MAG TPA: HD domain-containing phosphohydrolase [Dehalococcoidales bacterium]|nr:HD domain-containing phosphohydrolase [Dehalococcoidales bacterium]
MSERTDKALNSFTTHDQDANADSDMKASLPQKKPLQSGNTVPPADFSSMTPEIQIGLLRHELQETRDKYILLYDYAPNGYVTLDSSGVILEINLTLCAWLGIEKRELKGVDFTPFIAPDFQNKFEKHLEAVFAGKIKQQCEIRLKKKNGSFIPVSFESIAMRDSRGFLSQCHCTVTDITHLHKQIEIDRIQKTVSEISGQAILVVDKNLLITQWNNAAQDMFGWTEAEIAGAQASSRIRTKILEPLINNEMMKSLTETGDWTGDVACQRKDGTKFKTRVVICVIWDNTGSFGGLVAVFGQPVPPLENAGSHGEAVNMESLIQERTRDLAHTNQLLRQELNIHKQAALAARESEGKNRDLVDNIKLGIFRCTPGLRGRFIEVNKALEEISGYSRDELLNICVGDLITSSGEFKPFQNEITITDWKITHELNLKRKDGLMVTVAVTIVAIRFESGITHYFDAILEDITERKQAQLQIQQSLQRLQKTIKEIIEAMAYIGEVRDPYTAGHQRRVAQLSLDIGKAMGLSDEQYEGLMMAAFVHDIGKILVPADILSKPGKLTKPEIDMLRDHTRIGYEILKTIEFPWPIAKIVLQHHERIDGSGYPLGLAGNQIILEARILAVADVVEAMSSHRPYRPALGTDKALEEIQQGRGTIYDSQVVDTCLKVFHEQGFSLN